jgi:hypothetical protein
LVAAHRRNIGALAILCHGWRERIRGVLSSTANDVAPNSSLPHPWVHSVIRGSTPSSVGPLCYPWVRSAIRGSALLSVGPLCYPWVHSVIRGSILSSVGPLCHPWVHSAIRGRTAFAAPLCAPRRVGRDCVAPSGSPLPAPLPSTTPPMAKRTHR